MRTTLNKIKGWAIKVFWKESTIYYFIWSYICLVYYDVWIFIMMWAFAGYIKTKDK